MGLGPVPWPCLAFEEPPTKLRIVFFLHTPFPSFEIISTLPNCAEIVEDPPSRGVSMAWHAHVSWQLL